MIEALLKAFCKWSKMLLPIRMDLTIEAKSSASSTSDELVYCSQCGCMPIWRHLGPGQDEEEYVCEYH